MKIDITLSYNGKKMTEKQKKIAFDATKQLISVIGKAYEDSITKIDIKPTDKKVYCKIVLK
ncbi:MAG TPA: hypothetical protein VHA12_00120 [Candidatus Nanoarchaeia archaeon]|nr:hypothetical protein [Candidatus Nanoarchaeia archaeon]